VAAATEAPQTPLRGGRQRSDTISTHRVELGVWERERLKRYEQVILWGGIIPTAAGIAALGLGVGLGAWAFYKWAESVTGFVDDVLPAVGNATRATWKILRKLGPWGILDELFSS
jgi:hypothetical protein